MRILALAAILGMEVMAVSCAKPVWVAYNSIPPGAMITYKDGSGTLGITPFRSEYPWDQSDCLRIQGLRATWVSGAQAVSDDQLAFCGGPGTEFGITFQRPTNYPRYDEDLATSLEFETLMEALGQEPVLNMYRTMQQAQPGQTDINWSVKCRSQQIGNQIRTTCD